MNITEVRIRLVKKDEGKLKAVASVTFDGCFVVHDIKIFERDGECFIGMPSRKTTEGEYKDIAHPINTETRMQLQDAILARYREVLAESEEKS